MTLLNRTHFPGRQYPDRAIQFGAGNFMRAFIDWQLDVLNEHTALDAGVVVIRSIGGSHADGQASELNQQQGLYTTLIQGLDEQGQVVRSQRLIRCVNREIHAGDAFDEVLELARNPDVRWVFSNTTEAGIRFEPADSLQDQPPASFPAKLTRLLWERFQCFEGASDMGWVILPCELIDYNGDALKALVLRYAEQWQLPVSFSQWLEHSNTFCSTLVDRIVTGFPREQKAALRDELGYDDPLLVAAEHFHLLVIQGPQWLEQALCLDVLRDRQARGEIDCPRLNIHIVDDIAPYKERKVAILNGAHTAMVPVAYLSGLDTVGEAMSDEQICAFVEQLLQQEVIPVLSLPQAELQAFAADVLNRFRNPFIRHQLLSIALNGMTKFATRLLPTLLASQRQQGQWPRHITFSLAALLAFYRGKRDGQGYALQDDQRWLTFYTAAWQQHADGELSIYELVHQVLADQQHWQQDLSALPGLVACVSDQLEQIITVGMRAALPRQE